MNNEKSQKLMIIGLAVLGFLINGIGIPVLMRSLAGDSSADIWSTILYTAILNLIIWVVVYLIGNRLLKRKGFKTALIFMGVAVVVLALLLRGCMGMG